jgi:hypothetical protein
MVREALEALQLDTPPGKVHVEFLCFFRYLPFSVIFLSFPKALALSDRRSYPPAPSFIGLSGRAQILQFGREATSSRAPPMSNAGLNQQSRIVESGLFSSNASSPEVTLKLSLSGRTEQNRNER